MALYLGQLQCNSKLNHLISLTGKLFDKQNILSHSMPFSVITQLSVALSKLSPRRMAQEYSIDIMNAKSADALVAQHDAGYRYTCSPSVPAISRAPLEKRAPLMILRWLGAAWKLCNLVLWIAIDGFFKRNCLQATYLWSVIYDDNFLFDLPSTSPAGKWDPPCHCVTVIILISKNARQHE